MTTKTARYRLMNKKELDVLKAVEQKRGNVYDKETKNNSKPGALILAKQKKQKAFNELINKH